MLFRSALVEVDELDLPSPLHRMNVLVVDDNEINRIVVESMLSGLGVRFVIATGGSEAIAEFHRGHFDLILMDVQMPDMDGLEATRRIRKWEAEHSLLARTPIVAMTAHTSDIESDQRREAGMDGFLSKPFQMGELETILREYLPRT